MGWHICDKVFDMIVGYLTPDSDLDLTPDPDQFGALPPVRYINLSLRGPYKVVLRWLEFDRGGCNKLEN